MPRPAPGPALGQPSGPQTHIRMDHCKGRRSLGYCVQFRRPVLRYEEMRATPRSQISIAPSGLAEQGFAGRPM